MDLRLENLSKRFGERVAVEIPELTICAGEFFTFVGPSGCGKSTTLNLIAGLETPTSGTVQHGERRLNELPPHRRDVAFVFQSYALYPHRTVRRNLSFPLELAGLEAGEIARRVEQAAARLNITPLLEKLPRQLSGGERQRVALGRAMVRQPQLFLFDEPLSNLDAPLRAQMRKELKLLHQELGTTFIYVTHDQEEALSLSDRIGVMRGGRILQCAAPREIYDKPATAFVAGFFGSPPMNLLDAKAESGGTTTLCLGEERLTLAGVPSQAAVGGKLILGIRPEHVALSRESNHETWPARVTLAELRGGLSVLELEGRGYRLAATAPAEMGFQAGGNVGLKLPQVKLHYFDAETGERLGPGAGQASR